MAKSSQKKLGEILVEWDILKPAEIDKALAHAKTKGLRLGEALVDLKAATESQVYKALAQQQSVEFIDLDKAGLPPNAVNLIPDDLMKKYAILPLGMEGGKLKVAVSDMDFEMLDVLQFRLGKSVKPVFVTRTRIKQLLDEMFNASSRSTIDQTVDRSIDSRSRSMVRSTGRSTRAWTSRSTSPAWARTRPTTP
jgi:type IV pilus assembly protein PilB